MATSFDRSRFAMRMKWMCRLVLGALVIVATCTDPAFGQAPTLELSSPKEYQVFQRQTRTEGKVRIDGRFTGTADAAQFRLIGKPMEGEMNAEWRPVPLNVVDRAFQADVATPAGGWYRLEVRMTEGANAIAQGSIDHVGVGEVFVIAGQSNSTNYGSEPRKVSSDRVATFDGTNWRIADDPQPGVQDRSRRGSFIPAFGDAIYEKYKVPIAVASAGCGSTSVRQWLPKGHKIDVHPTTNAFIKTIAFGQWECTGQLYDGLLTRIHTLGPHGFRAVLWHQGESDAGQARAGFADRQITAGQYRALMEELIRDTQKDAGGNIPWLVAQATYHSPADPSDADFRAAQQSLWTDKIADQGPDTDSLTGDFRAGVHFNAKGLQAHGKLWADKVGVYLDRALAAPGSGR